MRAVSLASGVVAGTAGAGAAAGARAAVAVPMGRGTGVLAAAGGGGGTAAGGGGGETNVRGTGTLAAGGLGNGICDIGGRGIGTVPGLGTSGADVGGGSDVGGRAGRLIRTVSPSSGPATSPRRGGRLIRVVSFFGSSASAMVTFPAGMISLSEIGYLVTGELRGGREKSSLVNYRGTRCFVFFIGGIPLEYWSRRVLGKLGNCANGGCACRSIPVVIPLLWARSLACARG